MDSDSCGRQFDNNIIKLSASNNECIVPVDDLNGVGFQNDASAGTEPTFKNII